MKHIHLTMATLLVAMHAVVDHAKAADDINTLTPPGKEYVYKLSGGRPRKLEVYFPNDWDAARNKVPAVLLFHGGSWNGGDLRMLRYQCNYLASRGLVAATANYRVLSSEERAQAKQSADGDLRKRVCITDAKSAIRWMKQHADELGIDPQRIVTGGGSAGGHIAVLATTNTGLNDPGDPKEFDTRVAAYLLFNPAFQPTDGEDPEVDVLKHLASDFRPAVVFFGTEDNFKTGWDAVHRQLTTIGNTTTLLWMAEGQKHAFFNKQPWLDLTLTAADRFLVEHGFLKGDSTLPPPAGGERLVKAP